MQKNPVDEKTTGTLYEQLSREWPWLAKELQENKLFYTYAAVLYAAEDAANLIFSYFSLSFAFRDSFAEHSDSASAQEFHDYEATPEGLAVTIACAAFLVLFSSLGTYFGELDNKNLFQHYVALIWPYIRDMLKALKWAYKGIRSTLMLILQFVGHKELLFHLLFPIAIALGVLAVLNRVWLRAMKNERREMMKYNDALCDEILEKSNALNFKSSYSEDSNAYLANLNSFIYIDDEKAPGKKGIYYVRPKTVEDKLTAALEKIDITDLDAFDKEVQKFQFENLCRRVCVHFEPNVGETLHFLKELPPGSYTEDELRQVMGGTVGGDFKNTIIFITDPAYPFGKRLYRVDAEGRLTQDDVLSDRFEREIETERKKKTVIGLTPEQVLQLIAPDKLSKDSYSFNTYADWVRYKKTIKSKEQSFWLVVRCYLSTIYSALIDGMYFYMGVLFFAVFMPKVFIAMLAMASTLYVICFISRLYEEYEFQRRLRITQIRVELAKAETEFKFLEKEFAQAQVTDRTLEKISRDIHLQAKIDKLYVAIEEYYNLQDKLENEVIFGWGSAILEGLRNGLCFQGAVSSLMMLIMAIMLIANTPCPPIFILTILSIGMAGLIVCFVQYIVSYHAYTKNVRDWEEKNPKLSLEQLSDDLVGCGDDFEAKQRCLIKAKNLIDSRAINPPPQFYVMEWCEVFRLFFSGIFKAEKTFGELTYDHEHPQEPPSWTQVTISLIFASVIGAMFVGRTVKKMFSPLFETNQSAVDVEVKERDQTTYSLADSKVGLFSFVPWKRGRKSEDEANETDYVGDTTAGVDAGL